MNTRIKELWTEAGGTFTSGNQHEWPAAKIDNPEKFAELLIREIVGEVKIWEKDSRNHISYMIKRHYGVVDE